MPTNKAGGLNVAAEHFPVAMTHKVDTQSHPYLCPTPAYWVIS